MDAATGKLCTVGDLWRKLQPARELPRAGLLRVVVVADAQEEAPREWLEDGHPLRIIKAKDVADAIRQLNDLSPRQVILQHERKACATLEILGRPTLFETHYQRLPLLREVKRERLLREVKNLAASCEVLYYLV
ncbi:MAG: hypothetical protein AB7P69_14780 [Candidatus Binatia bacterium]